MHSTRTQEERLDLPAYLSDVWRVHQGAAEPANAMHGEPSAGRGRRGCVNRREVGQAHETPPCGILCSAKGALAP